MGASASVAQVNSAVSASLDIVNKTPMNCTQQDSSAMSIYVKQKHCGNQNIDIHNVSMDSSGSFNVKCAQSNSSKNDIQQQVTNQLVNTAASIVGSLGIGAAGAAAITNSAVNVATSITNSYSLDCAMKVATTKGIYTDQDGGDKCESQNVTISYINFGDLTEGTLSVCNKTTT
jgi:hypothetical protein